MLGCWNFTAFFSHPCRIYKQHTHAHAHTQRNGKKTYEKVNLPR